MSSETVEGFVPSRLPPGSCADRSPRWAVPVDSGSPAADELSVHATIFGSEAAVQTLVEPDDTWWSRGSRVSQLAGSPAPSSSVGRFHEDRSATPSSSTA